MYKSTSETSIYIVKSQEKPCWTLHVRDDKDEWQDVVLPTADNITSIKGVAIESGVISTDGTKEVSLYYGTANDKVKFGNPEIEYPKGYLFTSSDAVINAMVNPADIDIAQYTVTLEDSHGNTCFVLASPAKNMSSDPLKNKTTTRAEQWNKGIYDFAIAFANVDAKTIENGKDVAYALSTKNAWGKTILSDYDVKIKAETENAPGLTATTYTTAKDIDINEECILDDLVQSENVFDADGKRSGYGEENLGKVFAHYYAIPKNTKNVTMKEVDGKTVITSSEPQTVIVTLHYLKVDGTADKKEFNLNDTVVKLNNNDTEGYFFTITKKRYDTIKDKLENQNFILNKNQINLKNDFEYKHLVGTIKITSEKLSEVSNLIETLKDSIINKNIEIFNNFINDIFQYKNDDPPSPRSAADA